MKSDLIVIFQLIKRGIKIFLKDKAGVFFSLLAPMIIFVLYVLFLGRLQTESLEKAFLGLNVGSGLIRSTVDGWMIAGIMSVSCITVSFSAQSLMIADREQGILADALSSPVKRLLLSVSYLFYNFLVTLIICTAVLIVTLIYIAATGWFLSAADVFGIIGITVLSVLSVSIFSTLICTPLKTQNAHGAFVGIMSAIVGFIIGAYMPISMFPAAVQKIILFVPGTYSAGVYRSLFMRSSIDKISDISPAAADGVRQSYSIEMDFFGKTIGADIMWAIFAAIIALSAVIYVAVQLISAKNNTLLSVNKLQLRKRREK